VICLCHQSRGGHPTGPYIFERKDGTNSVVPGCPRARIICRWSDKSRYTNTVLRCLRLDLVGTKQPDRFERWLRASNSKTKANVDGKATGVRTSISPTQSICYPNAAFQSSGGSCKSSSAPPEHPSTAPTSLCNLCTTTASKQRCSYIRSKRF
jgi:hypothetical protein